MGKHTVKRHTVLKWNKNIPRQLIDYFDQEPYTEHKEKAMNETGEYVETGKVFRMAKPLTSIRKFAKMIGVDRTTIYDWLDPESPRYKKELAKAFKIAKDYRKDALIDGGLLNIYHHSFAKFVAVNMTDMVSDKKEIDQTIGTKNNEPIKVAVFGNPDA